MTAWPIIGGEDSPNHGDEEYQEATEEDIMLLARILSGG